MAQWYRLEVNTPGIGQAQELLPGRLAKEGYLTCNGSSPHVAEHLLLATQIATASDSLDDS
ncbi:MAG: hypothetical protein ABGX16_15050 [Pirellulales bacterium]